MALCQILDMCEFWIKYIAFLGSMVSKDGFMIDPKMIEATSNWARPRSPTKVPIFIGVGKLPKMVCRGISLYCSNYDLINQAKFPILVVQ